MLQRSGHSSVSSSCGWSLLGEESERERLSQNWQTVLLLGGGDLRLGMIRDSLNFNYGVKTLQMISCQRKLARLNYKSLH